MPYARPGSHHGQGPRLDMIDLGPLERSHAPGLVKPATTLTLIPQQMSAIFYWNKKGAGFDRERRRRTEVYEKITEKY